MEGVGRLQVGTVTHPLHLHEPLTTVPAALAEFGLELTEKGRCLVFTYDSQGDRTAAG